MSHLATAAGPSQTAARAWLFPGRIDLAMVVNWKQATMETMLHDLKNAREQEDVRDSTLIAGLRQFSVECARTLALCRTERGAASGQRNDGGDRL
jgi:hypothetical protein